MDSISKFLKGLIMLRGLGFFIVLLGLAFAAPIFVMFFTIWLYRNEVSEETAKISYIIAATAEVLMLLGGIVMKEPLMAAAAFLFILIYCGVLSFSCNAKARKNRKIEQQKNDGF